MELNNKNNVYYGHGTNIDDLGLESIFNNGLRCSHERLYYTSMALGMGSDTLFEEHKQRFENWPHLNAKKIVILSIPSKYLVMSPDNKEEAFYNYVSKEERTEKSISEGYYLMPEFVLGYYDSQTKEFINNPKYYEHLTIIENIELEEKIKSNYLSIIEDKFGIENYLEIISNFPGWEFPLSEEEVNRLRANSQKDQSDFGIVK